MNYLRGMKSENYYLISHFAFNYGVVDNLAMCIYNIAPETLNSLNME